MKPIMILYCSKGKCLGASRPDSARFSNVAGGEHENVEVTDGMANACALVLFAFSEAFPETSS